MTTDLFGDLSYQFALSFFPPDPDTIRVKRLRTENRPPDPKVMNAKLAREGSELEFDFGAALNAK